jgi:hypothetical protein
MSETQKCDVEMVPGEDRAWKLVIRSLTPACEKALRNIYQSLGPAGKRFLLSRIEASPEVKRALEEIDRFHQLP